jgi:hypothetical protein
MPFSEGNGTGWVMLEVSSSQQHVKFRVEADVSLEYVASCYLSLYQVGPLPILILTVDNELERFYLHWSDLR